jgi:hypothetical protein
MEIINYRPINKGALLGSFTVYVPEWGVEIKDMLHFKSGNKEWTSFPGKEYEKEGKKKYAPYIYFRFNKASEQFSIDLLDLINKKNIEKLEDNIDF